MGNVQGPEKVNDTCVKTVHVRTIDRGSTVNLKYHSSQTAARRIRFHIKNIPENFCQSGLGTFRIQAS
jgi:hypothetical protein